MPEPVNSGQISPISTLKRNDEIYNKYKLILHHHELCKKNITKAIPPSSTQRSIGVRTSDSSLKNSWAAHGPGNSNRLEVVVIHETNISKISSTLKDPSLIK